MKVLIIGAGGVIGGILAEGLALSGWEVIAGARDCGDVSVDVLRDDPRDTLDRASAPVVAYLAWATRDRSRDAQLRHAAAARAWASVASDGGRRFVFASTTLATSNTRSSYGRGKLAAERGVLGAGGSVARIGLVVDDAVPGLLATQIRTIARRSPLAADSLAYPVFPIGSGPLVCGFESALRSAATRTWLAEDEPLSLAQLAGWPRDPRPHPSVVRVAEWLGRYGWPGETPPSYVDGWMGLVSGPSSRDARFPPPEPSVGRPGGWRCFTRSPPEHACV